MERFAHRDKLILAGLYLSKFDVEGLTLLGFSSFTEAFNVFGLALGGRPASIKNYRDEFDPAFPNQRRGWHHRSMRDHCKVLLDRFGDLGVAEFTALIKSVVYKDPDLAALAEETGDDVDVDVDVGASTFAKRLITGQAAEQYFRANYQGIVQFQGFEIEDTTRLGCGFDFKLTSSRTYCGVEVKGLNDLTGNVMLTDKEYAVAAYLKERYFLFVVKNFKEKPCHGIYQDPVSSGLAFSRVNRAIVQVSWRASV